MAWQPWAQPLDVVLLLDVHKMEGEDHLHNVEDVEEVDVKKRTMFMRILWQAVAWRMDWKTIPFIIKYYEHYAIYFSICYVFYWEFPTELCDIFCGFASQKLGLNDVACCYACVRYC